MAEGRRRAGRPPLTFARAPSGARSRRHHHQSRDERPSARTALEQSIRWSVRSRGAHDIDSTTGREPTSAWLAAQLRREGFEVENSRSKRADAISTRAPASLRGRALDPLRLRAALHSEPSRRRADCRPGLVRREGYPRRQFAAALRLRALGERRVTLLFVVSEERAAMAPPPPITLPRFAFLIDGEPTDRRLRHRRAGSCASGSTRTGRAAPSAAPDHGE